MKRRLKSPSKLFKSPVVRGLSKAAKIEPDGGDAAAGCIRGFSAITAGEALGHELWIDETFCRQVADAMNAAPKGAKSRFTHPGFSGDGLGTYLGRSKSAAVAPSTVPDMPDGAPGVRCDLHFAKAAHETPDGDLASYCMQLAAEDPQAFGASIVFEHDAAAEQQFMLANMQPDDAGRPAFQSPDAANVNNYPHCRLAELRAVDLVDDPAANPAGMFHRDAEFISDAEQLAEYCLGLSAACPQVTSLLSVHPDRVKGFVSRFLQSRKLSLKGQDDMPQSKTVEAPADKPEVKPAEALSAVAPAEQPAAAVEQLAATPAEPAAKPLDLEAGRKYLAAFGAKGAVWFIEGKSYDEAAKLFAAEAQAERDALAKENADLKAKLGRGEATAVAFNAAQSADAKQFAELRNVTGSDGVAKFAASLKLPGSPESK